jgi:hypothetical protein
MEDGGSFWLIFGIGTFFILGIVAYFLLMFFYPELVGITGKVAIDAQQAHAGGDQKESDFWKKLDADTASAEKKKQDP